MNIGTKILHLVLEEEVIFFVKLVWEELLEAKISLLIPTQPDPSQFLSDGHTCHFWTPGGATDNTAQTQGF